MNLTEPQKQQIKSLVDAGEPLPVEFRATPFPNGALDPQAFERTDAFNRGFTQLRGTEWTTIHFGAKSAIPPANVQAAWPWRREIWTLHSVCRRSLGRAYYRHTTGDWAEWSDSQRELERLCFLTNALITHNGMEDRIAQLANCFNASPAVERDVNLCSLFNNNPPAALPKTVAQVAHIRADADWKTTHERANKIKHRWTGEIMPQLPAPSEIRRMAGSPQSTCGPYNPIPVDPAYVDGICESAQRSLNQLAELAQTLDAEIGWDRFFRVARANV